jgi:hypothetical protein
MRRRPSSLPVSDGKQLELFDVAALRRRTPASAPPLTATSVELPVTPPDVIRLNTSLTLPTIRAAELAAHDSEPEWMIEGLWGAEAVGIIGGEPKQGKTFVALDMAIAVATGAPCLRHFPTRRTGPVLLYAAEDSHRVLCQRLRGIAAAAGVDFETLDIDRGFGDHKLYRVLTEELRFDYLIRFRGNIKVTAIDGETRDAIDWVGNGGRLRILRGAAVTAQDYPVGAVVCVQAKDMKQPWCLATSLADEHAKTLLKKYAKRWSIECSFRDTKDPHFGMGMAQIHINSPERRDRLWLLSALAVALLTLLGAAGEALGLDKHLKASTTKRRVYSLFRQGCLHYLLMPTMREDRLRPLMEKFVQLILEQPLFADVYGII